MTPTGIAQTAQEAPAIISVITSKDIAMWQYQSVGESLQHIPGFYCINDFVSYNCGIRGFNGGVRAYSRIMKVMINSQPTAFRSDSANFLGHEFIPMNIIDRIEVVRGPSSALYGANAYLGVINVITKQMDKAGTTGNLGVWLDQTKGGIGQGSSLAFLNNDGDSQWNYAVKASYSDRSEHALPNTLPQNSRFTAGSKSEQDESKPFALFGQWQHQYDDHLVSVSGHFSRLDNIAEFIDFGGLSHNNRVSLDNAFIRADDNWQFSELLTIDSSLAVAYGQPSRQEKLNFGSTVTFPQREFEFKAIDFSLEGRYALSEKQLLTVGVDYTRDKEALLKIYSVDSATGVKSLTRDNLDDELFTNESLYIQYTGQFAQQLGLTLNGRLDNHSIYGSDFSYRMGLTYSFTDNIISC